MIGQTISRYEILEKLGEGGMGVVYKALDLRLDRHVALKFLKPHALASEEDRKRFVQEAQAAASLDHPNICPVYEIDEADGRTFISMAYLEGETVRQKIEAGPLSVEEALEIAVQVGAALNEAHEKGIVHRDVKSANIMISEKGQARIMDFGLARSLDTSRITRAGTTMGTPAYMSPEQTRGDEVDGRTDIWSLGVVLYEMLTGALPFRGQQAQAVMYSIVNEEPDPVRSLRAEGPEVLKRIVSRALAKQPDERYQQISDMLTDLASPGSGVDVPRPVAKRKRPRRRVSITALASIPLLLLVIGLLVFYPRAPDRDQRKIIAVLPFENLSPDPESEYYADGTTNDIRALLSRVSRLSVISRTSSIRYKEMGKSLREIAEESNVDAVLEGSVRRQEGRVRVVAELFDARTDEQLWAKTFEQELREVFLMQSEVAVDVALALAVELTEQEKAQITRPATGNLTAYDYYLKGREHYHRYSREGNEHAIELFKKAIELDPDYALAYAGLGDAHVRRCREYGYPEAWIDSAIVMSEKALDLDPNSSEAYNALGHAYAKQWYSTGARGDQAWAAFEKAIELNPSNWEAMTNLASIQRGRRMFEQALRWFKRARELNPTFANTYSEIGYTYHASRDYEEAEQWFKKALELQPGLHRAHAGLGKTYLEQDEIELAIASFEAAVRFDSSAHWVRHDLALVHQGRGDSDKAIAELRKAIEISPTQEWHYIGLASTHFENGDTDAAIEVYQEAREKGIDNLFLLFNYSLVLSHAGKPDEARAALDNWASTKPAHWYYFPPLVHFHLGEFTEPEMRNALNLDSRKGLATAAVYFLGMTYLLKLEQDSLASPRDTTKAIKYLKEYVAWSPRHDAALPMARAQLKRLGVH